MVLDIAYRMAILNPFLRDEILNETPGIVMIDEVDMHLHPKWQWNIIKALKKTFPRVQFIVTTHSPIVVASCKDENLILLNPKEESKYKNHCRDGRWMMFWKKLCRLEIDLRKQ